MHKKHQTTEQVFELYSFLGTMKGNVDTLQRLLTN